MASVIQLREERAAAFGRMKALHAKSERENRNFTSAEDAQFNTDHARIKQLDLQIESREQAQKQEILSAAADTGGERYPAGEWLAQELRALTGDAGSGASFTPYDAPDRFFDLLAAESVALRSGLSVIRTDRDELRVPRMTGDVGAAFYAQAATITNTSMAGDVITAIPRKLAGIERMSNELIADSVPAVLNIVGMSLVRSIGLRYDLAAYEGTGTAPEFTGFKNTAGIQTVSMGTNGAIPTNLDPFADAIGLLAASNAKAGAIVMHPRTWRTILKIKEVSGSAKPVIQEEQGGPTAEPRRSLYGVPVFLSSQISITETQGVSGAVASSAYVYEPAQQVAVFRNDTRVEKDSSRLFNSDESEVRAILRATLAVPNPASVCRILGILE